MRATPDLADGLGAESVPWIDRELDLAGRGLMSVREAPGPPGAPTLLLLHGLAATGRLNWMTALPTLAEHFRVVIVDHRGHGRGIRTAHFRLVDCADDAMAVLDELGIHQALAVGYSMGGPIAKLCWSRHPGRVRGLVLCATAKHFLRPQAQGVASAVFPGMVATARLLPAVFRQRMIAGMLASVPAGTARDHARNELAQMDPATVMQATRAVIRFSSRDWVSTINVPTAVLVMTRDTLVPPQRQRRLAMAIPAARIFEVEADHLACAHAADRFVPTLLSACEYVDARATERAAIRVPD